jgi:hypothetical protein
VAHVTDRAGNVGSSAVATLSIVANTPGPVTGQALSIDPSGLFEQQMGDVRIQHALDLDQSPGTAQSGDPALVYNSAWVDVHPVIQVSAPTAVTTSLPASLTAQLTFAGVTQTAVTYSTTGVSPGATLTLALQDSSTVSLSGAYPWAVTVTLNY